MGDETVPDRGLENRKSNVYTSKDNVALRNFVSTAHHPHRQSLELYGNGT